MKTAKKIPDWQKAADALTSYGEPSYHRWYKEVGSRLVPCTQEEFWGLYPDAKDRKVAEDNLPNGYSVSTVFLGMDHNWGQSSLPILYETMVFPAGLADDQDMARYATRHSAENGHRKMVEKWSKK